jgi:heme o synthase
LAAAARRVNFKIRLMSAATLPWNERAGQFWQLTKPRVTFLAVFCAVIGMFLATPGMVEWPVLLGGTAGIWLLAAGAFTVNCVIERSIDAKMARTSWRAVAKGEIGSGAALVFAALLAAVGSFLLYRYANPLTMWMTVATFFGYAIVYTMVLKPSTPQNIVIGGLSGAMPPALGWAAVANDVPGEAWLLVLIIFVWTPPHFWALALYRAEDYRKSGLPMLPVTHGNEFTRLQILLYTYLLLAVSVLPFVIKMSGWLYLLAAVGLGIGFIAYAHKLHRAYSDALARKTFRFSLIYLAVLFAALLLDHYWVAA